MRNYVSHHWFVYIHGKRGGPQHIFFYSRGSPGAHKRTSDFNRLIQYLVMQYKNFRVFFANWPHFHSFFGAWGIGIRRWRCNGNRDSDNETRRIWFYPKLVRILSNTRFLVAIFVVLSSCMCLMLVLLSGWSFHSANLNWSLR